MRNADKKAAARSGRTRFLNRLAAFLILCVSWAGGWSAAEDLSPIESVDAATRAMWLIDGVVVDSVSSEPIGDFVVTPGSLSVDDSGKSTVRWRDNLKREMKAGRLRWPRTSGFSVMRFRVTADGYRPAVTQRIWRGGPHTQIKVRLVPVGDAGEKETRTPVREPSSADST